MLLFRSQLAEASVSLLSETDRPERPPLLSTPSSTRRVSTKPATTQRVSTASTSPLARRDPLSQTSSDFSRRRTASSTPSSSLPPPPRPLLSNSWPPTPDAPSENTSVTTESTLSSSTTISQSRPLPTARCPFFSEDPPVVRLTQEMCSTSTLVSSREQPR